MSNNSELETPVRQSRRRPVPLSRLGQEAQIRPPPMDENNDVADETAEIILSHLVSHVQAQEVEAQALAAAEAEALSRPGPLESSSFAGLPSDSEEAEIDPALRESKTKTLAKTQAEESKSASDTQSVLSRLKKGPNGSCDICGRTETSVWRKLVLGGEDHKVCNGGLSYSLLHSTNLS